MFNYAPFSYFSLMHTLESSNPCKISHSFTIKTQKSLFHTLSLIFIIEPNSRFPFYLIFNPTKFIDGTDADSDAQFSSPDRARRKRLELDITLLGKPNQ